MGFIFFLTQDLLHSGCSVCVLCMFLIREEENSFFP